jgi:hypothetical protein
MRRYFEAPGGKGFDISEFRSGWKIRYKYSETKSIISRTTPCNSCDSNLAGAEQLRTSTISKALDPT